MRTTDTPPPRRSGGRFQSRAAARRHGARGLAAFLALTTLVAGVPVVHAAAVSAPDLDRVDRAIERGLDYLTSVQSPDGTFPGVFGKTTGVVALAGMAFLAKGYMPNGGAHAGEINRCIDYLLAHQMANGCVSVDENRAMYCHDIGTLFLCEVSGMVDTQRQARIAAALPKAVALIVQAQKVAKPEPQAGGWRYACNSADSDLSCSGWAIMALRSARLNGALVPDQVMKDAVAYVFKNHDPATGEFGYQDAHRNSTTLTGAAVLCLELTGNHGNPEILKAGEYILKVREQLPGDAFPEYGLYYDAQATFQLGGKYWETFAAWMYDYWLPKQLANGSWPLPMTSWMGQQGGTDLPFETAMMVLALAVPYRQLPIYQRDETVDESP